MAQLPKPSKPASIKIDDVYDLVSVVFDLVTVIEHNIKDVQTQALANHRLILDSLSETMAQHVMEAMGVSQQTLANDMNVMATDRQGQRINLPTRKGT